MERSSRVLHHGNPEMWKFFKKFEIDEIEFCPYPEFPYAEKKKSPWLRQYQSYIINWYVNGKVFTSTTTWEPKNLIFFSKKFEIEFDLYFDLCWRAEIIQVGLNMHLYVDIGDASSSLWGLTSSLELFRISSVAFGICNCRCIGRRRGIEFLQEVGCICKREELQVVMNAVTASGFVLDTIYGNIVTAGGMFTGSYGRNGCRRQLICRSMEGVAAGLQEAMEGLCTAGGVFAALRMATPLHMSITESL